MRSHLTAVLALAFAVTACDSAPTEATTDDASFEVVLEAAGEGASAAMFLDGAPDALRLTDEQRTAIRDINQAFQRDHRDDLRALNGITRRAVAAHRRGAPPPEVRAILEEARPIRERLAPAFAELQRAIHAVLTAEQRAWLRENARRLGPQLPPPPPRRP